MMTNDAVVDDTQDWVLACDVQQRFMQVWVGPATPWSAAHSAAKFQHSVAIAMISCLLRITAWGWSLAMLPAKVSPRRS
jgi:hypothetical protein